MSSSHLRRKKGITAYKHTHMLWGPYGQWWAGQQQTPGRVARQCSAAFGPISGDYQRLRTTICAQAQLTDMDRQWARQRGSWWSPARLDSQDARSSVAHGTVLLICAAAQPTERQRQ